MTRNALMIFQHNSKRKITSKEFDFIQQNFHKLPFQHLRKKLKVQDSTLYEWLLNVFKSNHSSFNYDELQEVLRYRFFLVEVADIIYLVEFDEPIVASNIKFCPIKLGVDCVVSVLGDYEFHRLKKDLYVFRIEVSNNYVYDFWSTTQFFLT